MDDQGQPCGCEATITDRDPRAEIWIQVFARRSFPISWKLGLYHENSNFPGKRFLNGDVAALSPDQRESLIGTMAAKFRIPPAEVADSLAEGILPILDEGISISFCQLHTRMMVL